MTLSKPREEATVWMSGTYPTQKLKLRRAIVKEKLSTLTETVIEFLAEKVEVDLKQIVGKIMTLHVEQKGNEEGRKFTGTVISVEAMGMRDGMDHFVAQVRPWFWMLTLERNIRVFQKMSVVQIIEEVLSDHEFSDYELKMTESYEEREYCVQYRETDFDFLSRLMEESGIYYFFDHSEAYEKNEKLIFCDGLTAHKDIEAEGDVVFKPIDSGDAHAGETIGEWAAANDVTRGVVSLTDYDFEKPGVRQMQKTSMPKGSHNYTEYEYYDNLGHYRGETDLGKTRTRIRAEADAIKHHQFRGAGDLRHFGTGYLFKLTEHPVDSNNADYLITDAVHFIQDADEMADNEQEFALKPQNIKMPEELKKDYSFTFGAVEKKHPYRAPLTTPWPEIPGIQIGEVVGPDGKEIHTDEYGRIRVLFRWDRVNKPDDTASCWIRVASQWTGSDWGLLSIPRIGQEVIIQFEDGDPDRPICTGMMYNKDRMPPFGNLAGRDKLRTEETVSGLMTRSSPGGGEKDFNAMIMEDEKGKEFVHFQSNKDYQMVVKDSSQITVGDEGVNVDSEKHEVDKGSLLQTVKKDVTEMVQEGNKKETVDQGTYDLIVEKDRTELVRSGNMKLDVSAGNIDITAAKNINMTAGQSISLTANQGITLTVGGSTIKVTQTGVDISGSTKASVTGSAMVSVRGGIVKIN